jgi:small-conductance mechanosensitive channel
VATLALHQIEAVAFLGGWGMKLLQVLGLVFLGRVAVKVLALGVEEVLITRATLDAHQLQRRETTLPLLIAIVRYTTYFGIGILICNSLNIDPTPFLAGAGIVGLALSLGAQKVINDVVSGFPILFENYFLIGDYVDFGEAKGWTTGTTSRKA